MTAFKQSQDGTGFVTADIDRLFSQVVMPETYRVSQQNKIWINSASGWLFKKKTNFSLRVYDEVCF